MRRSRTSISAWAIVLVFTSVKAFDSSLSPCPAPCTGKPSDWTLYTSVDRLKPCHKPMLLDFALHGSLDEPETAVKLFTCTVGDKNSLNVLPADLTAPLAQTSTCITGQQTTATLDLTMDYSGDIPWSSELDFILGYAQSYLADTHSCDNYDLFGYLNGTIVGIYSGAAIDNTVTALFILQTLRDQARDHPTLRSATIQLCGNGRNADYTLGVTFDTIGNLASVQKSVSLWSNAQCVETYGTNTQIRNVSVFEKPLWAGYKNHPSRIRRGSSDSGDCETESVVSGDSCESLAAKCGITEDELIDYNLNDDLCLAPTPGRQVCCTNGTLPNTRPLPNEDGSCAEYTIKSSDTCWRIAAAHGLEEADISSFNDGTTWGWFGCSNLPLGLKICVSEGNPPMPAQVSNAVCGPTVPYAGTSTDGATLAEQNPCPLNACCTIWGKCGITPEYCTHESGPTGNPGTAPAGHKGCVSNCGTDITNNFYGPEKFLRVGYYESWNLNRPCLKLRAARINVTEYTHIHWGFGTIDSKLNIEIRDTHDQWGDFLGLEGVRRIISFGGWGYSTNSGTYDVLRAAMKPENVDTFVQNIYDFLEENGLDGVDFDWEYPGAADIPMIPLGMKSDGPNYLSFLKTLAEILPSSKTISIAAPVSYWYLKAFPIEEMSKYLDYIVFMTYDLHGQWDYDSGWSQGNGLLSHVNLTETKYALAMVTKAGVPSNIITVGVTSYGRSFGMSEEGCSSPECSFEGPESTALPGICTQTEGMLANAEIEDLINVQEVNESFYDEASDSNILVYNDTQWVSYMSRSIKRSRIEYYQSLNFAGYADWAVDLADWTDDEGNPLSTSG